MELNLRNYKLSSINLLMFGIRIVRPLTELGIEHMIFDNDCISFSLCDSGTDRTRRQYW